MDGYLGEFELDPNDNPYHDNTPSDWAMDWITMYGQFDGAHHKSWVLDQVARILKGTPVIVREARWENGTREFRFRLGQPTQEYLDWVEDMKGDMVDGEYEYEYDAGIAP